MYGGVTSLLDAKLWCSRDIFGNTPRGIKSSRRRELKKEERETRHGAFINNAHRCVNP